MKKLAFLLALMLLFDLMAGCSLKPTSKDISSESDSSYAENESRGESDGSDSGEDSGTGSGHASGEAGGLTSSKTVGPSSGGAVQPSSNEFRLSGGNFTLHLKKQSSGWVLFVSENGKMVFKNNAPAAVTTVATASATPVSAVFPYSSVKASGNKLVCEATVTTDKGSVFRISDTYHVASGTFLVDRNISVTKASANEKGFATVYSLYDVDKGKQANYDYFIPSIFYKDTIYLRSNAIMYSLGAVNYVKETRCGTPIAMLRGKNDGYSAALVHVDPKISVASQQYKQASIIDNKQQYGSLGFVFDITRDNPVSVDYVYPAMETPVSYEIGGTLRRYHTVSVGTTQKYTLGIVMTKADSYNDAMVDTYLSALALENPTISTVDQTQAYNANLELYDKLFLRYEGSDGKYSAGFPGATNVINRDWFDSISFQIGFIGAQTTIASEMVREGVKNKNTNLLNKGQDILNFWTSSWVYNDALPPSWWQPSSGSNGGSAINYPSFLRCMVDGAEGILNACMYAKGSSANYTQWEKAAVKIADFLVKNQNSDGSYYRAYNTNGTVCTDNSSPAYNGTSKLNTPVAVRFLCNMYEYTKDSRYRNAAIKAADYSYKELYLNAGKYVGGTPDNPNVPDKEASIYALYAFSSVYDMTGDEKYYPALEHAAVSAMSWVLTYDFAVPYSLSNGYSYLNNTFDSLNIFKNGGTAGWSFIATGHSMIDVFGSNAYYELFKQYLRSGNTGYQKVAGLLQNNAKKAMDLDGNSGYRYRAFCLEASNVSDQIFYTAENGVWLPWISAAFMEPMIQMEETFGGNDLYQLSKSYSRQQLLSKIK